jgi:glucokinase
MSIALGVDIGGSHITAGWVDLEKAVVLKDTLTRKSIDSNGSAESIISGWCSVLQDSLQHKVQDNTRIGIAMPGPFDYAGGISYMQEQGKFKSLYGMNVRHLLAKKLLLPAENFIFINDAESFLQGEVLGGAGKGYATVLGLTLGTGLGAALYNGGGTRDADLWKMPFKEGIAEDYLSTRWFVSQYYNLSGKQERGLKEIISNADPAALHRLFTAFSLNFSEFLVELSRSHRFEAVILGGNISQSHGHFLSALEDLLSKQDINVALHLGVLQEEAALIGAAGSWKGAKQARFIPSQTLGS